MPDIYKLQYDGMTLAYPGWNGYVSFNGAQPKSLTLYHSEGGTLTANELTGYPGDTINLTTAYNTYWRFSGYQLTGDGELVGNDYTFGMEDATICACYKVNAFTATGTFNFSNWNQSYNSTANKSYNAILKAFTGSKPSNWPATNGNWNVTNASAYGVNANTTIGLTKSWNGYCRCSASITIGGSRKAGITSAISNYYGVTADFVTCNLSKNTTQGQLAWSGKFSNGGERSTYKCTWRMPTNAWTATGYAP